MKRRELLAFALCCVLFGGEVRGRENLDPNGTWKWSVTRDDQQQVDFSLTLKYADGKLTGTVTLPNKKNVAIENASFKDGEVTFSVTQEGPNSRKITTKYKGKLDGDTIKGKREVDRNGNVTTHDWETKREKV